MLNTSVVSTFLKGSMRANTGKNHPIFRALHKSDTVECLRAINSMTLNELMTLHNNSGESIVHATLVQMNDVVLKKLIEIGGSAICNVKTVGKNPIFKVFLKQARSKPSDCREEIFKMFYDLDNIDYRPLFEELLEPYVVNWMIKLIEKGTLINTELCNLVEKYIKMGNISRTHKFKEIMHLANIIKLDEKSKSDLLRDLLNNEHIVQIPTGFNEYIEFLGIKNLGSHEVHKAICKNNKLFFNYFVEQNYHLINYNVNIIDAIVAHELHCVMSDEKTCGFWISTLCDITHVNAFEKDLNKQMDSIYQSYTCIQDIINNMIFRTTFIYYIMKLLNSPVNRQINKYTKLMLKDFVVSYRFPTIGEVAMNSLINYEIEYSHDFTNSNNVSEIVDKIKHHYCLNCGKLYCRNAKEMVGTVVTYNREISISYVNGYEEIYTYSEPTVHTICKFSFCSAKCQIDYTS